MSRPGPVSLDPHFIGSGDNALDREAPVAQLGGPNISVALNALLLSTDAAFAEAMEMANLDLEMANLDLEMAEGLLDIVSAAQDGEPLDSASAATTGSGGGLDSWEPEAGLTDLSLQATGLPEWHILTTDEIVLAADYESGFGDGDYDAFGWGVDFSANARTGHEFSSSGDLIFLDVESYARPSNPGGGGGNGGGNDNKGGGGGNGGGSTDPDVVSGYISGQLVGYESAYNIEIDFKGSWTSLLQEAFIDSAEWISSIISGDVADVFYRGNVIDDLKITAELVEIDGVNGILGQAGPTAVRTADYLPAAGMMEFDVADAQNFYDMGFWDPIVLHEMLHTVGFGSIWDFQGLVDSSIPDSPTFTGQEATLAYQDLFGGTGDVPLEYGYGPGTDESHWDEALFDNELMTGFIDTDGDDYVPGITANYVSGMTVASLVDLGYSIDPSSYDQQVEFVA